ncbi:SRPBCC family protein [Acrocarpospora catenulata]|uniref:SRPBCC family protein n=1 Tax=Acrocarpospora catenulata TaxID=2836182 RepID=UPI001BDA2B7E|nr:SRPBCC family protein [Acrocarpospora catenulata]
MRFESAITIDASPQRVWEVFSDVERWPEWAETFESVELTEPGPLKVGSRAKIKQPKLPASVWEVTELVDGEYFVWVSRSPGMRVTGGHRVEVTPDGTVARSTIDQEGLFSPLLSRLTGKLTSRYLTLEAQGLKARIEQA